MKEVIELDEADIAKALAAYTVQQKKWTTAKVEFSVTEHVPNRYVIHARVENTSPEQKPTW